jgi:Spy/CpxP family protein refolding chaperone
MIMRRRMLMAAAVVVAVAAMAAAQPPQGGGRGMQGGQGMRPGGPGGPGNPMAALKLTQEQRVKVQEIQQKQRDANKEYGEKLRQLNDEMRAAMFGDNPSQATEIAKQVGQLEAQLLPSRVAMQIEIIGVLTPDQKKIAQELNLFGPGGGMGKGGPVR